MLRRNQNRYRLNRKELLENRRLACEIAAGLADSGETKEQIWSRIVLFNAYMDHGADWTMRYFGPQAAEIAEFPKVVK